MRMKAYQIVDFNNPVSVEYSLISRDSFRPALERGLITGIERIQAVTPETLPQYEGMFNWREDLTGIKKGGRGITDTEKSGNVSHWLLMRKQSESDERFLIMEHDAFMLNSFKLEECMDFMNEHQLSYANLGLFMSCYSYSRSAAEYCWGLLTKEGFPINCGPYGVAERLFKTYADRKLKPNGYFGREFTFMTHHSDMKTIGPGKTAKDMFDAYNGPPDASGPEFDLPTTQVVSRRLKVTQIHDGYSDELVMEPWKRSPAFAVID